MAKFIVSCIPPFVVHNIGKYFALKKAFYLASLEDLEGDYIEFGVFTGSSFSCSLICGKNNALKGKSQISNFYGFDSFEGFGDLDESDRHPFYTALNFKTDYEKVKRRLEKHKSEKMNIHLIKGFFDKTLDGISPEKYGMKKAAIILVDSDTLSSARSCFNFCTPLIQEGTLLILDDYFSYRGHAEKGVAGAFSLWKKENPHLSFRRVSDYGMGGALYIVSSVNAT